MNEFQTGLLLGAAVAVILVGAICLGLAVGIVKGLREEHDKALKSYGQYCEAKIKHTGASAYAQGLGQARIIVAYQRQRYSKSLGQAFSEAACVDIAERLGEKLVEAEKELEIAHAKLVRWEYSD